MLNKYISWFLIVLATALLVVLAMNWFQAKQKDIVWVDIEYVFNQFDMKREYQSEFESYQLKTQSSIDSLQSEVDLISSMLKGGEDDQNLIIRYKILDELLNNLKAEMKVKLTQYDEQIISRINNYVSEFAKEAGYNLIVTESAGCVLYADSVINVSDQFILYLNAKYNNKE